MKLAGYAWMLLAAVWVAGCTRGKESADSADGPDPEVAKLVGTAGAAAASSAPAEPASPMVIPPPPAATLGSPNAPQEAQETPVKLVQFDTFEKERQAFAGKYLVFDGWATWCGICKEKFPAYLALSSQYPDRTKIVFASIANDPADKEQEVKDFLASLNATIPTFVLDEDPADFAATFDVNGVPAYLLYDPEGKLIFRAGKLEELSDKLAELFPPPKP
jgi:thiol-disulfide isomerase/thioredoxin